MLPRNLQDGRPPTRARGLPARASRLVLLPVLLALCACSGTKERWAEATYANISYPALYNVVLTTIDAEGYPVRIRDPQKGRVESDWVYGASNAVVRGPARRKVFARIEAGELDSGYLVRVRVSEEVIPRGGILATRPRDSDAWEPWDDNFEIAEYLMAKVEVLLNEKRVPGTERASGTPGAQGRTP